MLKQAPFEFNDQSIRNYIDNYLTKSSSSLLNETQLLVVIEPVVACINEVLGALWSSKLFHAISLLQSLYDITLVEGDTKEANSVFIEYWEPIRNSKNQTERHLYFYLHEFWQLCQGRLDRLKLDRIGESCEWLGVGDDDNLYFQRRAKAKERTQLVKQILRDFLQQAIEAAKENLVLRQAETAERSTDFPPPSPGLRRQP